MRSSPGTCWSRSGSDEANAEVATALRLDPESWDVNKVAGKVLFLQGRYREAAACYEKAAELMEADYHTLGMLECCYRGLGDRDGQRDAPEGASNASKRRSRATRATPRPSATGPWLLECWEKSNGPRNGRSERWHSSRRITFCATTWLVRSLTNLGDPERALDLIEDSLTHLGRDHVRHTQADPDIASLHDHPQFKQMIADAKERLNDE